MVKKWKTNEINEDADTSNVSDCAALLEAAKQFIQREWGNHGKSIVPWWRKKCEKAIKSGNRAFQKF